MGADQIIFEDHFSHPAIQRGGAYFRGGRVQALHRVGHQTWEASVQGSEPAAYDTAVMLRQSNGAGLRIHSNCSCPLRSDCKHVVATLLAVQAHTAQPEAADPTRATAEPDWLETLEQRLESPLVTTNAPETENFAYWIAPYDDQQVPKMLHLELGQLGGRKGAKKFVQGRRHEGFIDARYPHDPHRLVDAWLRLIFPPTYSWDPRESQGTSRYLDHPQMAALVQAMARTGRLYYGLNRQLPLTWSKPRTAGLVWHLRPDLQQQLGLDLPTGVLAIAGEAAVYIDPVAHQVGPLEVAAPAAVLEALSSAPLLQASQIETFRTRLDDRMQGLLPPPRRVQERKERLPPQPQLTLTRGGAEDGSVQLRCRVAFRYGEALVDAQAAEASAAYVDADGDTVVTVRRDKRAEAKALRQLGLAEGAKPGLLDLAPEIDAQGNALLGDASTLQAYAGALERLAPLQNAGWTVVEDGGAQPEVLRIDAPVQLTVEDSAGTQDAATAAGEGSHWFDLRMDVEVQGQRVDLAPLLAAALNHPEIGLQGADWAALGPQVFLPLDSHRVIALPTARVRALLVALRALIDGQGLGLGNAVELTHLLDTGDCVLQGRAFMLDLARRLRACEAAVTQPPPAGLRATLRPYQQHGLNWLAFLREHGLAGVLADDMGLGKTLQTLAHLLSVHEAGAAEGPFLVVMPTSLLFNWQAELERFAPGLTVHLHHGPRRQLPALEPGAVLLTSYGVLLRDAEQLAAVAFDTVVLDEAHAIKNPRTKLHHAARGLQAKHRLCLSGTPLQNHLEELWAQFAFLMPGLLGGHGEFTQQFRTPIEKHRDVTVRAQLAARLRPFMLRRQKAEVARELPPKTEMIEKLELVGAQRDLYETVRNLMDDRVRGALAKRGIAASSIVVLDALLKLRQVCCDARLVKTPQAKRVKSSAKLDRLLELVQELVQEGRRVLVFSQFTSMLALIAEALDAQNIAHVRLTGQTRNRAQVVREFQEGTAPVFLLSLKAGGVGLNLTAADTVIHYDPWWNPSAENQATDRAHRIGQDKPVFVYKLIVAGSVEERILELQRRKLQLSQSLVDDGAIADQLTQADLDRLFAPLA